MHTYRKIGKDEEALWVVGYFDPQNVGRFTSLRDFGLEAEAIRFVNYLNGGDAGPHTFSK